MTSLVKTIALYTHVIKAGFSLSGISCRSTDDGYSWQATLCSGKTKIVTVSNGGYGGPDEYRYQDPNHIKSLASFYSLPMVDQIIKESLIETEQYRLKFERCTSEEFETKKAAILKGDFTVDEDLLGIVVDELRSAKEVITSLKRKLKSKTAWFTKGQEDSNGYNIIGIPDTPDYRKQLIAKYPDISIFVNDLINDI